MTPPMIFSYEAIKNVTRERFRLLNFSSWEEFAIRESANHAETKLQLGLMTALASEYGCPEEKIKLILGE